METAAARWPFSFAEKVPAGRRRPMRQRVPRCLLVAATGLRATQAGGLGCSSCWGRLCRGL